MGWRLSIRSFFKVYKSKGLGFLWRHFRGTHGKAPAFMKYRKPENIQHQQSRFSFVQTFFVIYSLKSQHLKKPSTTLKWFVHLYMWRSSTEDQGLWEEQRNIMKGQKRHTAALKKEALQEDVGLADKGSKYYEELIRGLPDPFGLISCCGEWAGRLSVEDISACVGQVCWDYAWRLRRF